MKNYDLRILSTFLEKEKSEEELVNCNARCFGRYVIKISYNTATFITSEPFKQEVSRILELKGS